MPQRLDDVTGDPIRLSASQRERQREAMIERINAQTRQINALTAAVNQLQHITTDHQMALAEVREVIYTRTVRQRLRWLFTGR